MKTGYDQFFKSARKAAEQTSSKVGSGPKIDIESLNQKYKKGKSDILAEELRAKIKPAMAAKRKKKQIPWKLMAYSFLGVCLATVGLYYAEELDKKLHQIEISLVGATATAQVNPQPSTEVQAAAGTTNTGDSAPNQAKRELSSEEINHFKRLAERKRELDQREEELNRMEQELAAQQQVLEKKIQELQQTRRNISSILEEKVQADEKKVETLVQVYSNMKPQQAAAIFEAMDEDLAVEILGRMKKKNAADIMNLIKAEKAQVLTEKYAGYKRD